jgi:excisionase family DNA binding protein
VSGLKLIDFGLLTVADVCGRFGCSAKAVQNWIAAGRLAAIEVGGGRGTYLVPAAALDDFVPPPRGRPKVKTRHRAVD